MRFLLLHGPNLNLLGEREPDIYGSTTPEELRGALAGELDAPVTLVQSNHEGTLIDALHAARGVYDGIVFNPGAYAHYSYALYDAIRAIAPLPVVEVHLSDINNREEFRHISVTAPACQAQFSGEGILTYKKAGRYLRKEVMQ